MWKQQKQIWQTSMTVAEGKQDYIPSRVVLMKQNRYYTTGNIKK